jgi:hypothetical protein
MTLVLGEWEDNYMKKMTLQERIIQGQNYKMAMAELEEMRKFSQLKEKILIKKLVKLCLLQRS